MNTYTESRQPCDHFTPAMSINEYASSAADDTQWVRRVYDDPRYVATARHAGLLMPDGEFVAFCGVRLPARTGTKVANRLVPAGDGDIRSSDVRTCSACRQIVGRRVVPLAESFATRIVSE